MENNGIPGQGNGTYKGLEARESRLTVLGELNYKAEWAIPVGKETREFAGSLS